ncbi:Uncharacterised protein r2_g417 [Pycnogonum litorale]
MSAAGVGRLQIVQGMMNAAKYIETLQTRMLPSAKEMFPGEDFVFQDDNAPCHRENVVKDWFAAHNLKRLDWSAQSPDLNPIENLWHKIGYEISKKKPTTKKKDLIEALIASWHRIISSDLLKKLVLSMSQRCSAVIKSKGWPIK